MRSQTASALRKVIITCPNATIICASSVAAAVTVIVAVCGPVTIAVVWVTMAVVRAFCAALARRLGRVVLLDMVTSPGKRWPDLRPANFFCRGGWGEKPAHGNDGATLRPGSFRGSAATARRKVFGALAVAQRSEGLRRRARVMQYRREPDVRQEIECFFAVRSAAEFGSEGRPQGGRHRRQAECETACRRRRVTTSHLRSSPGDCAGATETGHARCRGSS